MRRLDRDGTIATCAHPCNELYGAGTVFDGADVVRGRRAVRIWQLQNRLEK